MSQILYYPYINLPKTDWTLRTLLYYDNVGSIVPQEYFYHPEQHYDPFMLELVRENLVTPINPMRVLDDPWKLTQPFLELISNNEERIKKAQIKFIAGRRHRIHQGKFSTSKIHSNKFDDEIFYGLIQLGLAERINHSWYAVENRTADHLMKFLASIVSVKTDRLPTTDYIKPKWAKKNPGKEQQKRETILHQLIPFPQDVDLRKVMRFKEKHNDLLVKFRNKVERIALDPNIKEGSALFDNYLSDLTGDKEELYARMNENQFNKILYGSVCGVIGAVAALPYGGTTGAALGALPGFANAIYSALQTERAEDIVDQTGLKYLALMDKRIRS